MPRPPLRPETRGLRPWKEVAEAMQRLHGVELTPQQCFRIHQEALRKMRTELEARGVTVEVFRAWIHDQEASEAPRRDFMGALLALFEAPR